MIADYNLDPELADAIQWALNGLMNVPQVGEVYDQQHSDTQLSAYLRLQAAFDKFEIKK